MIAEVIIDIKNKQVNQSYDYIIPSYLEEFIKIGSRVEVSFGKLKRLAFVINIKEKSNFNNLKEIDNIIDIKPIIDEEFIDIAKYISKNNFSYYIKALDVMVPRALKIKYQKICYIKNENENIRNIIKKGNKIILDNLSKDNQKILFNEAQKGNIIIDTVLKKRKDDKKLLMVHLNDFENVNLSYKGKLLVDYLIENNEDVMLDVLIEDQGFTKNIIDTLVKHNIISLYEKEIIKNNDIIPYKSVTLNKDQKDVISKIEYNKFNTYLLHGVTSSGKTEVYMKLISNVIDDNKKAIMLVPEISLTPQVANIFKERFGKNIAILHSGLTLKERFDEWKKITSNEVKIVLGARSAIFAPLKNIGIIIIDECHESSYIQDNNPKYSAIEIAKLRAKYHNAPLLLGSATPKVIDYYYATNGEYKLLELKNRANGMKLSDALIVDLKNELKNGNKSPLSIPLQEELKKNYKNNKQSILFLNRRGFSTVVLCRECGITIKCPHCDMPLTYHDRINKLTCHYCGYEMNNVSICPNCGSSKIRFLGNGTEKIEAEVKKLIPSAKIIRIDNDTTKHLDDYYDNYFKFKNHEADILIGTQMITKGLDFPLVTLVGILNADLALSYPTFDAKEVCFDLIEQVSGRCGRSKDDGKIIIQTYNPFDDVIKCAARHDYEGFYNNEIKRRQLSLLPPFSIYLELDISSKDEIKALNEANIIYNHLDVLKNESQIYGPCKAFIFKKNDIYHYKIEILTLDDKIIDYINEIYPIYQNNKDITLDIRRKS